LTSVLITGGTGFFGGILKRRLLNRGVDCVSIDLIGDKTTNPHLSSVVGDIRDRGLMERLFAEHRFTTVYHCAAMLAHAVKDKASVWTNNVEGTRTVAEMAGRFGTRSVVFISSNCLWARPFGRPVREDDEPAPVEVYGRSKWEGEKVLRVHQGAYRLAVIRCPTIIDEGRLGLLAILFEFIAEGRRVWVVGGGHNVYQFVYAEDLADACVKAADRGADGVFNVGSDNVRPFREVYRYVIDRAGTGARLASAPRAPAIAAMRLAYACNLSPLGPYQYRMIAEDFVFDTAKIKRELGWQPTLSNEEMLWRAYRYYQDNRADIERRIDVSAHREAAPMGAIRLLKWVS
jgi:nucleoside-diphosphate-sugar epimerase